MGAPAARPRDRPRHGGPAGLVLALRPLDGQAEMAARRRSGARRSAGVRRLVDGQFGPRRSGRGRPAKARHASRSRRADPRRAGRDRHAPRAAAGRRRTGAAAAWREPPHRSRPRAAGARRARRRRAGGVHLQYVAADGGQLRSAARPALRIVAGLAEFPGECHDIAIRPS